METFLEKRELIFYLSLIFALILGRVPIVGRLLKSLNTLIHETGHVLSALILSNEVIEVNLFADNTGNTITKSKNKFSNFVISISGYTFSSIVAFLCLVMLYFQKYNLLLFILSSVAILALILTIRNTYGIIWVSVLMIINTYVLLLRDDNITALVSTVYTLILWVEALWASIVVFRLSFKTPKKAGDATQLSKLTNISPKFWGFIFLLFAITTSVAGVYYYFPSLINAINQI